MLRTITYAAAAALALGIAQPAAAFKLPGVGTKAKVTSGEDSAGIQEKQADAYNGPKARIAVARFTDKTGKGWWTGSIGDGMADQLTTALFSTNRYIVLERQTLGDVLREQDLGASGRIRQDTAAPIGEIEGAELLIVGAVTEFEGNASGAQGSGAGARKGILGALTGGFKRAHMAIDLRVIDAKTSRVLAATSVEGSSTGVNLGALAGAFRGSGTLVAGLSGWQNTPVEKALRVCIKEAVDFVVSKTPQTYYRHGAGQAVATAAPAAASPSGGGTTKSGLTKNVVQQMQSMLASLGYDVGTPDGLAGKKTVVAVKQFQEENGLDVSGELTPATMKMIRKKAGL
ncbi:MAG: peptidoglycan-binding protein [Gammaproteobacteria bacterium]|nr:peptidoglycan-binding protein [Gammaproteobacteria bacterium]